VIYLNKNNKNSFKGTISRTSWIGWYQKVSILDFIGAKDDEGGGNNWSYKTCKFPVKMSPPTNKHQVFFLQTGCPSCRPTNSVKALEGKILLKHQKVLISVDF